MFRQRRAAIGGWRPRLGVFVGGMLGVYSGLAQLKRGIFVYHNYLRAEVYSAALVVMGGVLMFLALIPDSIVDRLVHPRKQK